MVRPIVLFSQSNLLIIKPVLVGRPGDHLKGWKIASWKFARFKIGSRCLLPDPPGFSIRLSNTSGRWVLVLVLVLVLAIFAGSKASSWQQRIHALWGTASKTPKALYPTQEKQLDIRKVKFFLLCFFLLGKQQSALSTWSKFLNTTWPPIAFVIQNYEILSALKYVDNNTCLWIDFKFV